MDFSRLDHQPLFGKGAALLPQVLAAITIRTLEPSHKSRALREDSIFGWNAGTQERGKGEAMKARTHPFPRPEVNLFG